MSLPGPTQISVQNFTAVRCAVVEFIAYTRYGASRLFSRLLQCFSRSNVLSKKWQFYVTGYNALKTTRMVIVKTALVYVVVHLSVLGVFKFLRFSTVRATSATNSPTNVAHNSVVNRYQNTVQRHVANGLQEVQIIKKICKIITSVKIDRRVFL